MKKLGLTALLFAFITYNTNRCLAQLSQIASAGNIYSPPSPNASALLKYANVPVDEYTGIASVVLPVDQLAGRQIAVPITLSYHASGNKMQDLASNVGLGFVLNAGGVITRVMRGLPDESAQGYQYNGRKVYSRNIDSAYLNATMNNKIDGEADMFYLNFMGHTGKLVVDTLGNPQYLPDQGLRVIRHPIHSNPDSTNNPWVIKDLSGMTYVFGTDTSSRELSVIKLAGQPITSTITYNSSWYLTQIISADGKEIVRFNYNSGPNLSYTQYRTINTYTIHSDVTDTRTGIFSSHIRHTVVQTPTNVVSINVNSEIKVLNAKYLNSIQNDMGSVTFSYTPGRSDLSGGQALNQIKLYNIDDSATPIKTYTFNTSYFISPSPANPTDTNSRRLRLDCVSLQGRSAETKQLYVFTYNEQTQLPPRSSDEFDHWGYYTKLDDRAGPTPVNLSQDQYGNYIAPFEKRAPDSVRVKAWMLTQVRNMNGGYTKFYYTIDDYKFNGRVSLGGGVRIKTIVETDSLGQVVPITTQYGYLLDDVTSSGMIYNPVPYYIQGITNYQPDTVVPPIPSLLSYEVNSLKKPLNIAATAVSVGITLVTASNPIGLAIDIGVDLLVPAVVDAWDFIFHRTHHYFYDSPPFSISSTPLNNLFDINGASVTYSQVEKINSDGSKIFNYYTSQIDHPDSSSAFVMNFNLQAVKAIYGNAGSYPPNTSFDFERGLLKRSILMDNNNNPVSSVTNTYQLSARAGSVGSQRSGISGYAQLKGGAFQVITYNVGFYKDVSENIQLQSSVTQLYDQSNNGNAVSTVHSYTWQPVYPTLMRSEATLRSDGNTLVNYYTYPMEYTSGTTFIDNMVSHYMLSAPIERVSTLVRHFGTTTTPIGTSIIGGVVTRYKPGGLGLPDTVFSVRASNPIPLASFKFSNQLTGVINGSYQPYHIDNSYVAKAFYQNYDSKNNLIQAQNLGEPPSSVIWGYNQDVPVATISNAAVNQVAYTSFETNDQRYWTFTSSGRDSTGQAKTGKVRYQLSSGTVSTTSTLPAGTYVLSLWTKGTKPTISGTTADVSVVNGESDNNSWNFYMDRITVSGGTSVSLTGSGLIDELRLYPYGAHMSTVSITPQIGTSSTASMDDKVNTYEYDPLTRIKTERDDQYNILKEFAYSNVPQVLCAINPDKWVGIDSVCYSSLTGVVPNTNNYSAMSVNSYGNLLCNFSRKTVEGDYAGKINYTIRYSDSTTYANSTIMQAGVLNATVGIPLALKSAESVTRIGIDTVINLSDDYGQGYQHYTNRKRLRDGYTEANTINGGIGPYIAPVQSNSCPALFSNQAQTNFYKNNCTTGNGSLVNYVVAANLFTGTSQFKADSIARAYGQAYANTNGNCTAVDTTFVGIDPYCITSTADSGTPSTSSYGITLNYQPQANIFSATVSRISAEVPHDATVTYTMHFSDGTAAIYTTPMYKYWQSIVASPPLGGYGPANVLSISVTAVAYTGLNHTAFANRKRLIDGVPDGYTEANTAGTYYLAPIENTGACGTWFYNTSQTGYYKNDCPGGAPGMPATYTVAAHTDSSMVSQMYADALARVRGQTYANSTSGCYVNQPVVTAYAGNSRRGVVNGSNTNAEFHSLRTETMDAAGNLYVVDGSSSSGPTMIRKITPAGMVSTFAGDTISGFRDSVGTAARFAYISGITTDAAGNVYAADGDNWMVRKITPTGVVSVFAGANPPQYGYRDGQDTSARFFFMNDIASDAGGTLYVLDNWRIRKITPGALVSTFAGGAGAGYRDGKLDSARFNFGGSGHVVVDPNGIIYLYDSGRMRKIVNDTVYTVAGDGTGSFYDGTGIHSGLGAVSQIAADPSGNILIADFVHNCIRKITPAGVVSTISTVSYGYVNGTLSNALFSALEGIVTDSAGNIYVSDGNNYVIRKITPPY